MVFQIVEIETTTNNGLAGRKIIASPVSEQSEAVQMIEVMIAGLSDGGFDQEHGYWWGRDAAGTVFRFIIESL